MYVNQTIGEATYLKKSNEHYIPLRIQISGIDCKYILPLVE